MIPFSNLLLCALLWPPFAAAQDASPPQQTATEEVPRVWSAQERGAIDLLRSLRKKERLPDAELASRLANRGDGLLPFFFEMLMTRAIPAHERGKPQVLSEIQENVILLAVGQLDRNLVLGHVSAEMLLGQEPERRLAALACVGAVGHGNDFPALFELALVSTEHELDRAREKALRRAVTTILTRDPKAFEQLTYLRRIARAELLDTLVSAVGDTRDGDGLAFLSDVAYWHPKLMLEVMCQVRLVGPSSVESVNDAMRVRMRPYLDESQPGQCRAAIMALTTLEDCESIGPLIALLKSESSGLREDAHWALRTLTGLALSHSYETWARWHQAEVYWLMRQKPREFQRLKDNDPAVAADALRSILTHPLARKDLLAALPDLLQSRRPAIRVLTCSTLAELSATEAVSKLVAVLEDPEPDVSKAAYAALCKLTKLDLPSDPLAWQEALSAGAQGAQL